MTDIQSAEYSPVPLYVSSSHAAPVVLELKHVTKMFKTAQGLLPVIDGLDLKARSGELIAIVGPSGCGKSSLLNIIAGLDQPSSGSILHTRM
ncbi:MAG TPA: ATP-binding cassette domain-containing protein [Ktedonobacteraceae bacterium]|jgi:ABC-type sugar transport system ATPase subunit